MHGYSNGDIIGFNLKYLRGILWKTNKLIVYGKNATGHVIIKNMDYLSLLDFSHAQY
jgi:hypothetical protein